MGAWSCASARPGFEQLCRLEDFDWSAQVRLDRRLLDAACSLQFLDRREQVTSCSWGRSASGRASSPRRSPSASWPPTSTSARWHRPGSTAPTRERRSAASSPRAADPRRPRDTPALNEGRDSSPATSARSASALASSGVVRGVSGCGSEPAPNSDGVRCAVLPVSILARPEGRALLARAYSWAGDPKTFQSSPGPKAGRSRRAIDAAGQRSWFQSLARPEGRALLVSRAACAAVLNVFQSSPRPEGRAAPAARLTDDYWHDKFNPRPARRPGAPIWR